MTGGGGDDSLIAGAGADTLIFAPGSDNDEVADFVSGEDILDVRGFGFGSAAEVLALASDDGSDTTIQLAVGDSVTLLNTLVGDLQESDLLI